MDQAPEISVILPVRDGARTLPLAIVSVLEQSFRDFELIILDDGSADGTPNLVARFADPRIRLLSDGIKRGLVSRLNQGIDTARGRYLARMDADDVCFMHRLERQHERMQREPSLDLLACRALTFDSAGQVTGMFPFRPTHGEICAHTWRGFYFPHPTWMGRIEWFRQHHYRIPETIRAEDQELLLRTYPQSRFAVLDDVLFGYRIGVPSLSKTLLARRTLLKAQLGLFSARHEYVKLALALASAGVKSANDILRAAGIAPRQHFAHVAPEIVILWQEWLTLLSDRLHEYGLTDGLQPRQGEAAS